MSENEGGTPSPPAELLRRRGTEVVGGKKIVPEGVGKEIDIGISRGDIEQKREEMLKWTGKLKGKERRGSIILIFDAFCKAVREGEPDDLDGPVRRVAESYQKATEIARKLEEPGRAEELLVQMRALYEQAELGEYRPEVLKGKGEEVPEVLEKVGKKLVEDLNELPERMVGEYLMKDYLDLRAREELERERLGKAVGRVLEGPSRSEVRGRAFEYERTIGRSRRAEDKIADQLGLDEKTRGWLNDIRKRNPALEDGPAEGDTSKYFEKEAVGRKVEELKGEFEKAGRSSDVSRALENLDAKEKTELVGAVLELEGKIKKLREYLLDRETLMKVGAVGMCKLTGKLRDLEVSRLRGLSNLEEALAKQRRIDSVRDLLGFRKKVVEKIVEGRPMKGLAQLKLVPRKLGSVVSAYTGRGDWTVKYGREAKRVKRLGVKGTIADTYDRVAWRADRWYENSRLDRITRGVRAKLSQRAEAGRLKRVQTEAKREQKRINSLREKYKKKHKNEVRRLFESERNVVNRDFDRGVRWVDVGKIVARMLRVRVEGIEERRDELRRRLIEEHKKVAKRARERASDNPYYQELHKALMARVSLQVAPAPAAATPAAAEAGTT